MVTTVNTTYDIQYRAREVETFILTADLDNASDRLLDFVRDFDRSETFLITVMTLVARCRKRKGDIIKGVVSYEQQNQVFSKLVTNMLEIIKMIIRSFKPEHGRNE